MDEEEEVALREPPVEGIAIRGLLGTAEVQVGVRVGGLFSSLSSSSSSSLALMTLAFFAFGPDDLEEVLAAL